MDLGVGGGKGWTAVRRKRIQSPPPNHQGLGADTLEARPGCRVPGRGGVVSRGLGRGRALIRATPRPASGQGRGTLTSLQSCGLHQPSGGDPGESPHLRAVRSSGSRGTSAPALGTAPTSAVPG